MKILRELHLKEFLTSVMNLDSKENIGVEKDSSILKGAKRLSSDCYAESNVLNTLKNGDYVILYNRYVIIPENEAQLREVSSINKIGWVYSMKMSNQGGETHIEKVIIMVEDRLIEYEPSNVLHFFEKPNLSYKSIW
jgi:hypothetical protein